MSLTTTDSLQLQMQSLVPSHDYRVEFKLNNPSHIYNAHLDREIITFTAGSTKQNIFVLLTKSRNQ
jgi:hypothetical protein